MSTVCSWCIAIMCDHVLNTWIDMSYPCMLIIQFTAIYHCIIWTSHSKPHTSETIVGSTIQLTKTTKMGRYYYIHQLHKCCPFMSFYGNRIGHGIAQITRFPYMVVGWAVIHVIHLLQHEISYSTFLTFHAMYMLSSRSLALQQHFLNMHMGSHRVIDQRCREERITYMAQLYLY